MRPESFSYAWMYFSVVFSITSAGKCGGLPWRSQLALEPVAALHELLVEAFACSRPTCVIVGAPEARAVGSEHLVTENRTAVSLRLRLRVGDDDALFACMLRSGQYTFSDRSRMSVAAFAHDFNRALEADVLVVVADLGLRGRREQRLGKLGGILQARRKLDAAYAARFLVILKARTSQVAAYDALDRNHLGFLHDHEAAVEVVAPLFELFGQIVYVRRDQVVFDNAPSSSNQKQLIWVRTLAPLWGISSSRM